MVTREEVLKEVSRLYDVLYTDHFRKECIVDYIMRLVPQGPGDVSTNLCLGEEDMPTKIDQRRLRDGEAASNLPKPFSIQEMRRQLVILHNAICAMQSLDDLGSVEANKKAWNDMLALSQRYDTLKENLESAQTAA